MELTRNEVRELFFYEPSTGWLIRRNIANNRVKKGDIAGTKLGGGRLGVRINRKQYLVHRLIWLYHFNYFPKEIDHKDGNAYNNKLENLRKCSRSQNMCNVPPRKNCSSKYKGVHHRKDTNKWQAYIWDNKNKKHLGYFNTERDAAISYNKYAKKLHGEFAKLNEV